MFYHSFPRPKPGQDSIQKGINILDSFLKNGILLVPETVTPSYRREKDDRNKPPDEYSLTQSRFCLTQIDISELKAHEKYFGSFHIEFKPENAYALGAMPVFYLPRAEPGLSQWSLKNLAASYLYQLHEMKIVCQYIQYLDEEIKDEKDGDIITLQGENRSAGKVKKYPVNVKQLRDTLDMITQNLIPGRSVSGARGNSIGARLENILGALTGIASLFYPTDKDYGGEHEDLYFFRQREWRIAAGICIDGIRLDRELTAEEKDRLITLDPAFFRKKMLYANGEEMERIDECYYMPSVIEEIKQNPGQKATERTVVYKPVQRFVERIIVPKEALEQTKDIATQYNFDISRIVDFESAMKLEIRETEYEAVKTQCRIQMLKAALAGC